MNVGQRQSIQSMSVRARGVSKIVEGAALVLPSCCDAASEPERTPWFQNSETDCTFEARGSFFAAPFCRTCFTCIQVGQADSSLDV